MFHHQKNTSQFELYFVSQQFNSNSKNLSHRNADSAAIDENKKKSVLAVLQEFTIKKKSETKKSTIYICKKNPSKISI